METIKEIIVFLSQFLIIILPLLILALFVLLLKFITYKADSDDIDNYSKKSPGGNTKLLQSNIEFNKRELNLNNFTIKELEECLDTKKTMNKNEIHKQIENIKEEIVKLKEEKQEIEEDIVAVKETKQEVVEEPVLEEVQPNNIEIESIEEITNEDELMLLIDTQLEKFKFRIKHIRDIKQFEKLLDEYEKFKKYKKYAKPKFEEFEKKLKKKSNELIRPTVQKQEEKVINQDIKPKVEERPVVKEKPVINKEEKIKELKKVNTQIKSKENKLATLEICLCSYASINNVIKKKSGVGNKEEPKPKRIELKTKIGTFIAKQKMRIMNNKKPLPKGKTKVFNKPKKNTVLQRINRFINKIVVIPIMSLIRMERIQNLEKERIRREEISSELEQMKKMRRRLHQVRLIKKIIPKQIVIPKKKEEKDKPKVKKKKVKV